MQHCGEAFCVCHYAVEVGYKVQHVLKLKNGDWKTYKAAAYFPLNAELAEALFKLRSSQGNVKVDAIHIGHATTVSEKK